MGYEREKAIKVRAWLRIRMSRGGKRGQGIGYLGYDTKKIICCRQKNRNRPEKEQMKKKARARAQSAAPT